LIQDEISRLKSGEIGDKQKKYLKNQIKSILKEYLSREFENLKNIEDIRLLRGDWLRSSKQKIFQTMMLELKERILLKYGYPSDIMEIFRGAANEIEIDEIKRENCRAWVEKKFTIEKMVDDYEKIYYQISSFRRKRR